MEPMAIKMLQESPELKKEFEQKITTDSSLQPVQMLSWMVLQQNKIL
jgi:hypothetical protein